MSESNSNMVGVLSVLAMIVSGTANTVFSKMQYGLRSHGTELCADPTDPTATTTLCAFDKPWFGALLAKIGMSLSCVILYVRYRRNRSTTTISHTVVAVNERAQLLTTRASDASTASDTSDVPLRLPVRTIVAIAWPSLLDLLQTLISNVGLLWVSSSVYQMARGSVVVFSAIVSVQLLRKRLYAYHYASILLVSVAVVLVGWAGTSDAATESPTTSSANAVLGLGLIIAAQFITAIQIVSEEYLMTHLHVQPLQLVGIEGLWGLFFYAGLIPALTLSPHDASPLAKIWHEDFGDSIVKVSNSLPLFVLSLLNILAVAALGPSANYVTKHLSGVMRSIAEVLRTLGVWVVCLGVYYGIKWRGENSPGEAWNSSSWLELAGFTLMVYGTLAFKKIIRIPMRELYYADETYRKSGVWVQQPLVAHSA